MNCLVTGATGFLGRHLCMTLRERGHSVVAGLRREVRGPWDRVAFLDLAGGDISPSDLEGVSCVFHLAGKAHALSETAQDSKEYIQINTTGTRRLLEAAKEVGVRQLVFFSSVKAMGEGGADCIDESFGGEPTTAYGRSKRDAERLVLEGGYIPHATVLRLSMVYGPTNKGNLPRMIEAIARGRFPPMADLGNRRSMVHVEDVVQAALLAAKQAQAAGQTYILTDGRAYSTRQMYEWICEALGRPVPNLLVPPAVLTLLAKTGDAIGRLRGRRFMFDSDALEKLTGSACYCSEKIQRDLGFRPERDLRESLPEIVAWLGLK